MALKTEKKVRDLLNVLSTNGFNLAFGIVTSIVIPLVLTVKDYAELRTYLLYVGYVGLTNLGFNDGLYLKYGSFDYDKIPHKRFRSLFLFLILLQLVTSIILFLITRESVENSNIAVLISITSFILNLDTFIRFVNQFSRRFHITLWNNIVSKLFILVGLIPVLFGKWDHYLYVSIVYVSSYFIILVLDIMKSKELVFGEREVFGVVRKEILGHVRNGFLIMIGSQVASLILGFSQFFVQRAFGSHDFAMFAFSFSILNFVYAFIGALSTVFFPYLARVDTKNLGKVYMNVQRFLTIVVSFFYAGYFIVEPVIRTYLIKYTNSLSLLACVFPIVMYYGMYNVLYFNCYKVLGDQKRMLRNNMIALVISIVNVSLVFLIFRSVIFVALVSLLNYMVWTFITELDMKRALKIKSSTIQVVQFAISVSFVIVALTFSWIVGCSIYLTVYLGTVYLFFRNDIKAIFTLKLNFFIS